MITDFRLTVFKTVADRLSFTRAAEELFISQPAVTKHINELERQLGTPLFRRHGNTISLTEQGAILLGYANRILDMYRLLNDTFMEATDPINETIRLGASTTISQYVLPAILARFKRCYPGAKPILFNGNTEQIEHQIADDRLDFGLIEGHAGNRTLHYETFMNDSIVLVTSGANSSIDKRGTNLHELRHLPIVIRETGSGTLDVVERALSGHGLVLRELNVQLQLGSTESIKHYLYATDAYAFLSTQAIADEVAEGRLRIIPVAGLTITRQFSFVTKHGAFSRSTETFKQFCLTNRNQ